MQEIIDNAIRIRLREYRQRERARHRTRHRSRARNRKQRRRRLHQQQQQMPSTPQQPRGHETSTRDRRSTDDRRPIRDPACRLPVSMFGIENDEFENLDGTLLRQRGRVESRYNVPRLQRIHRYNVLVPRSRFHVMENSRSGYNVLSLQRTPFTTYPPL